MIRKKKPIANGNDKIQFKRLKTEIEAADAIVIGGGAGLSASAGFTYQGQRFQKHFREFEKKYGFHDMYSGGFYPYQTAEEYWAYWSRYIQINRYENATTLVYGMLLNLVKGKDYFVITTNVDHCFQKAGFDKKRLFYMQGDYGLFQCSKPCCQKTYDNKKWIDRMVEEQINMRIPTELIPKCPVCGRPMTMNLRTDDRFVEDAGWHHAALRYYDFIQRHKGLRILFLELGVGYNTPGIIKYSFWKMTAENPNAMYACINDGEAVYPQEIESQSICIDGDIGKILEEIDGRLTCNGCSDDGREKNDKARKAYQVKSIAS
ncbi:MAG: Sir2 silent information regulator family NAD-dependent deacetylase [Clostridiales bacterium]|nr:Sir2 silent information regulator family NAD-dependent deacetylase [Clostridiales bacterium]